MPSRRQLERMFGNRIAKLSDKHRRQLIRLLGEPPDVDNVPQEFWDRVERETRSESMTGLLLVLLAAAGGFAAARRRRIARDTRTRTGELFRERAEIFAQQRANELARRTVDNARRRLANATQQWRERTANALDITDKEQRAEAVFGPGRTATVARTEVTGAKFRGEEEAAELIIGPERRDIWVLGRCRHCEACPMLAGTPRQFWGQFSSGPPLHVACCCRIWFAPPDTPFKRPPSAAAVRDAMLRVGAFGF